MQRRVALLTCLVAGALACGAPTGVPAPDFVAQRLDGTALRLADLRGRMVLIDFWATWCTPCVAEIPELNAVYARTRERGVEVIGLSVDDLPLDEIGAWAREHGVEYPVALADMDTADAYGAHAFPFHVIVGPDGTLLEALPPGDYDRGELLAALARNGASID